MIAASITISARCSNLSKTYFAERVPFNAFLFVTQVEIPKFRMEDSFDFRPALESLGLGELFTNDADFSKISVEKDLYVSNVLQKTFVEVCLFFHKVFHENVEDT